MTPEGSGVDNSLPPASGDITKTQAGAGMPLGPYRIEGPLGSGGMGQVFRARDSRLGRTVVIKISDARFSDRFEREARAISALNHPHICTVHDVGPNYPWGSSLMRLFLCVADHGTWSVQQGPRCCLDEPSFFPAFSWSSAAWHSLGLKFDRSDNNCLIGFQFKGGLSTGLHQGAA